MKIADDLTLFKHINKLTEITSHLGIHLEYGSDFTKLWTSPRRQPDRHPVNPGFNPNFCDLNPQNAFWVMGFSPEGDLVHTQAIKLLDNQEGSLADHFEQNIWEFRTHGYNLDPKKTRYSLSPEAEQIRGRVTYHGEVWMKAGRGGYRGGSLIVLLTRLFLMKALLKWSPDYMIGLQSPLTSCRGLGIKEGYMRTEQRTILWYEKEVQEPMEDWMVWMSGEDARYNLRLQPELFYSMFKKNTEPELTLLQKREA